MQPCHLHGHRALETKNAGYGCCHPSSRDILLRAGPKVNREDLRVEKAHGGRRFGEFRRLIADAAGESEGLESRSRPDPSTLFRLNSQILHNGLSCGMGDYTIPYLVLSIGNFFPERAGNHSKIGSSSPLPAPDKSWRQTYL